jgi:hypothetical protein
VKPYPNEAEGAGKNKQGKKKKAAKANDQD